MYDRVAVGVMVNISALSATINFNEKGLTLEEELVSCCSLDRHDDLSVSMLMVREKVWGRLTISANPNLSSCVSSSVIASPLILLLDLPLDMDISNISPIPTATIFPTSPAHNPISLIISSSIFTKASATPKGDGSSSNRLERVRDKASKRGKRSKRSSRGEVVGDGGAACGRGRVLSMGDTFMASGDKWVDEELVDVDTEFVEREVVRRDRNEVRLGS